MEKWKAAETINLSFKHSLDFSWNQQGEDLGQDGFW